MRRKTKIVATVSNLNCSKELIQELFDNGMNVVRLNTAYMTHDNARQVIDIVRSVSNKIAILLDTKGPEIRTCAAKEPLSVKHGDTIQIKGDPQGVSEGNLIYVSYGGFVADIPKDTSILIDDGCVALTVVDKDDQTLTCRVENDGQIQAKKSLNIPSVHVRLPALSEKDKAFIEFAADMEIDFIAHSFVRNKSDALAVQAILDKKNSPIKIIAKIENQEGVENLNEILDHVYGIMIARGDLSIEIPTEQIPLIQKSITRTCIERRRPVIVATQMLHSMMTSPRPTRAEVSDVANACIDGVDALMLSGETASGKYPVEAIQTMARIAREVESKHNSFVNVPYSLENKRTAYLAKAAVKAAFRLDTQGIVADSMTGKSILALAAYRGANPIYAQVYDEKVMRWLSLSFGVYPDYIPLEKQPEKSLQKSLCRLVDDKVLREDTLIIILAGSFGPQYGASYIEVATAGSFKEKFSDIE